MGGIKTIINKLLILITENYTDGTIIHLRKLVIFELITKSLSYVYI